jgi:hypothetical protein
MFIHKSKKKINKKIVAKIASAQILFDFFDFSTNLLSSFGCING